MKSNKINLLDCTLRDGGYYNNWFFNKELINEYLKVMDIIKVINLLTVLVLTSTYLIYSFILT